MWIELKWIYWDLKLQVSKSGSWYLNPNCFFCFLQLLTWGSHFVIWIKSWCEHTFENQSSVQSWLCLKHNLNNRLLCAVSSSKNLQLELFLFTLPHLPLTLTVFECKSTLSVSLGWFSTFSSCKAFKCCHANCYYTTKMNVQSPMDFITEKHPLWEVSKDASTQV